jgi:hypothetical protein
VSALTLEPRIVRGGDPPGSGGDRPGARGGRSGSTAVGGEPTLDALLAGVWEGLVAHRSVPCPVCGDEMKPDYGAHALPIGGSCGSCGTRLS